MAHPSFRLRTLGLVGCGAAMLAVAACSGAGGSHASNTVTVAVVANPQMEQMEGLIRNFEAQNPGIKVQFDTLPEDQVRSAIQQDIATDSHLYDVIMISNYETPFYAKNGWLTDLSRKYIARDPGYDVGDLVPSIARSLSYHGDLYSVPFYGESSILYYRKDLFARAGLTMPEHPTWPQVASFAGKLDRPGKVAGICLRGQEGWGENLAALDTVVNTFGGEWFSKNWQPQLTSPAFERATEFYVNLLKRDGEPGAASDGFTELLTLYTQGKCAMWYDATVGASSIAAISKAISAKSGYAFAPRMRTRSSGWLYTWSLGIPSGSTNQAEAWSFVNWATSKSYIRLVGTKLGWSQLPPGSRMSTYAIPQYRRAAKAFARITLSSIDSTDSAHPTVRPVPYSGIQFVDIPQFENLGDQVSQQIAAAIAGTESVSSALQASQRDAAAVGQRVAGRG